MFKHYAICHQCKTELEVPEVRPPWHHPTGWKLVQMDPGEHYGKQALFCSWHCLSLYARHQNEQDIQKAYSDAQKGNSDAL